MVGTTKIAAIVRAGQRAPSGDNCQPWRFEWDGERLGIFLVSERADSLYDVRRAASWVSLGAVLTNMRVAARRMGLGLLVELFPHAPNDPSARVRFQPGPPLARDEDPLWMALEQRCVNRRPYRAEPIAPEVHQELLAIAGGNPEVRLDLIDSEPLKSQLAALAARNDRILFENRRLHDGLYRWLRWSPQEAARTQDGMPIETLELNAIERAGFRLLQWWTWTRVMAGVGVTRLLPLRAERFYRQSAAIGLLSVEEARPEACVRAGEIFERLWLTATLRGLSLQPITGIAFLILRQRLLHGQELSATHRRLVDSCERALAHLLPAIAKRTPIMLFRIGRAPEPSGRAPRRAMALVFRTTP